MKHLFSDTGQQAAQDCDLPGSGDKGSDSYDRPSFLPREIFSKIVAQVGKLSKEG